jgi:hypothetical protein
MGMARNRSLRDALLILVGAFSMHITTSFFGVFQPELFTGDIIVSTQVSHHDLLQDPISQDPLQENFSKDVSVLEPSTGADVAFDFPETTIQAHAPGWTVFRNLYMSNGTIYIVTSNPVLEFPDIKMMTSTGLPAENTPENIAARMPTSADMDFITPEQAAERWGVPQIAARVQPARNRIYSVLGSTFLFNDPSQFLDHYYHFCAELLLGAWAMWQGAHSAQVDPARADLTSAPAVSRAIFPHADANGWRDRPGFNSYFLRAAFPSLTVEVAEDWRDRVIASSGDGEHARAWHFEKVLFTDRSAAFRGIVCGTQVHRTAGESYHHMRNLGQLAKWWWEPVRRAVLRFADIDDRTIEIGVHAKKPPRSTDVTTIPGTDVPIIVTYISRQGVRRHLINEDHERLVQELTELCRSKGWELNVVQAERLTKEEQLELVAKTTVSRASIS